MTPGSGYGDIVPESLAAIQAVAIISAGQMELPDAAINTAESYGYLNACLKAPGGR